MPQNHHSAQTAKHSSAPRSHRISSPATPSAAVPRNVPPATHPSRHHSHHRPPAHAPAAGPATAGRNCRSAAARVKAAADRRAVAASPDRTPSYFPRAPTPGTPPASAGHGRARPPSHPRSAPPARPRRPSAAPDSPNHAYHFSSQPNLPISGQCIRRRHRRLPIMYRPRKNPRSGHTCTRFLSLILAQSFSD